MKTKMILVWERWFTGLIAVDEMQAHVPDDPYLWSTSLHGDGECVSVCLTGRISLEPQGRSTRAEVMHNNAAVLGRQNHSKHIEPTGWLQFNLLTVENYFMFYVFLFICFFFFKKQGSALPQCEKCVTFWASSYPWLSETTRCLMLLGLTYQNNYYQTHFSTSKRC